MLGHSGKRAAFLGGKGDYMRTWLAHRRLDARLAFRKFKEDVGHAFPTLIPARVRYWVLVHEGVRHIRGHEVVPTVSFTDILHRSGRYAGIA